MIYCISDIHGCYDEFMDLLQKIDFNFEDTLYVLGDVVDRGRNSIRTLQYVMRTKNIHMLKGNHEEIMINAWVGRNPDDIELWLYNGGEKTANELENCSSAEQKEILEYLKELPYIFRTQVNNSNFILVHAGLQISKLDRKLLSVEQILAKQSPEDMLWIREQFYAKQGLPEHLIIFGHTQLWNIDRKYKPADGLWRDKKYKDKIGIDGGCVYGGGLYALCLNNMKEYYVEKRK